MGYNTVFVATVGSLLVLGSCQASVIPLGGISTSGITRGSYSYVDGNGLIPLVAAPAPLFATGHAVLSGPAVLASPAVLAGPTLVASPAVVAAAPAAEAQPSPSTEASSEAPATEAPSSTPETSPPAPEQPAESSPQPEQAPAPVNPYEPVQDTPEVVAARAQHLAAVEETKARDAATGTTEESSEPTETPETPLPVEEPSSTPAAQEASSTTQAPATPSPPALIPAALPAVRLPTPTLIAAPLPSVAAVAGPGLARVAAVAAPSVAPLAVAAVPVPAIADAAQYRYQDELGQWAFGHVGGPNAREEVKTADGITRGGYSYIDGNGLVQNAAYVADPLNGFRVAASNLPVQPAPQYIADSPEVQEAKEELFRRQEEHVRKLKEAAAQQ